MRRLGVGCGLAVAGLLLVLGIFVAVVGPTTLKRWAYEEPGRDRWQQPERVLEALALRPGLVVADVGSGGGYFAFRLAEAVGSNGKVYACDIDTGLNRYVAEQTRERGLDNLVVVEAAADDPHLPEPVDLLFTSNTVHHFADPAAYFAAARRYLRPGARVAVIDYREEHGSIQEGELVERLGAVGFELEERFDFLAKQYFVVLRLAEESGGENGSQLP